MEWHTVRISRMKLIVNPVATNAQKDIVSHQNLSAMELPNALMGLMSWTAMVVSF